MRHMRETTARETKTESMHAMGWGRDESDSDMHQGKYQDEKFHSKNGRLRPVRQFNDAPRHSRHKQHQDLVRPPVHHTPRRVQATPLGHRTLHQDQAKPPVHRMQHQVPVTQRVRHTPYPVLATCGQCRTRRRMQDQDQATPHVRRMLHLDQAKPHGHRMPQPDRETVCRPSSLLRQVLRRTDLGKRQPARQSIVDRTGRTVAPVGSL